MSTNILNSPGFVLIVLGILLLSVENYLLAKAYHIRWANDGLPSRFEDLHMEEIKDGLETKALQSESKALPYKWVGIANLMFGGLLFTTSLVGMQLMLRGLIGVPLIGLYVMALGEFYYQPRGSDRAAGFCQQAGAFLLYAGIISYAIGYFKLDPGLHVEDWQPSQ